MPISIVSDICLEPLEFCRLPPPLWPWFPENPPPPPETRSPSPLLNPPSKSLPPPPKLEPPKALLPPNPISLSNLDNPRGVNVLFPCPPAKEACKPLKLPTPPPKLFKFDANSLVNEEFSSELVVRLAPKPAPARLA